MKEWESERAKLQATTEEWRDHLAQCCGKLLAAERVTARLREALSFARSVIKSGEPWSPECERMISGALNECRPSMPSRRDDLERSS